MLHVNPLLREQGFMARLFDMTLPEMYFASGLTDFREECRRLKPTSFMRTIGYTIPLRPGAKNFLGRSVINFFGLKYLEICDGTAALLQDNEQYLYARLHDPEGHYRDCEEQNIYSGDTVQLVTILYDTRDGASQLIAIRKHLEIPASDLNSADVRDLVPAFGFS